MTKKTKYFQYLQAYLVDYSISYVNETFIAYGIFEIFDEIYQARIIIKILYLGHVDRTISS